MKILALPRAGGKTDRLIQMAHGSRAYIVCPNPHTVSLRAKQLGCDIMFPLTYDEFIQRQYHARNVEGFYIDNLDMMIQYMSVNPVLGASVTVDNDIEQQDTGQQDAAVYSKIEDLVIRWNNDGQKTAGHLTRQIMAVVNTNFSPIIRDIDAKPLTAEDLRNMADWLEKNGKTEQ